MNNHSITKNKTAISKQQERIKRVNTIKGITFLLVILSFLALSISNVSASELSGQASVSYGGKKDQLDDQTRNLVIAQNSNSGVYDQLIGKAKAKTRAEIIAEKQSTTSINSKGVEKSLAPGTARYYVPEFSVYDATTFLEDDIDGDGYYRTFGVIFDVDVYNPNGSEQSVIYAELYLSTDGVNWEHYYSTDDFLISGNSPDDQFEVITTLAEGYNTQNYDVLIDIYEVGYSDIVVTYSSNDSNALYALPLESAEYDTIYIEEVTVHGGSQSTVFLLFTLTLLLVRKIRAS